MIGEVGFDPGEAVQFLLAGGDCEEDLDLEFHWQNIANLQETMLNQTRSKLSSEILLKPETISQKVGRANHFNGRDLLTKSFDILGTTPQQSKTVPRVQPSRREEEKHSNLKAALPEKAHQAGCLLGRNRKPGFPQGDFLKNPFLGAFLGIIFYLFGFF